MNCILDELYTYHGYWTPGGVCRIEVFEAEGRPPVILCTELPENTNTSITNMAEYLAAEVVLHVMPGRLEVIEDEPFLWIEHYPYDPILHAAPTYDHVTFATLQPRITAVCCGSLRRRVRFGAPTWHHLQYSEMAGFLGVEETTVLQKGGVPDEKISLVVERARRRPAV